MQEHLSAQNGSAGDAVGPIMLGVFTLLVAVGLLIGLYFHLRANRRKLAAYRAFAARYGFRYAPYDSTVATLSTTEPFGTGFSQRGADVFRGKYRNHRLMFFQYDYGHGKDTVSHQVVAIVLPAERPLLDISHEGFWSKRFGDSIDFENQAFNDRFKITSPNRRFAFDVLNARTMEWMLADQRCHSYRWRFEGPWLMTYRLGRLRLEEVFFYADFLIDVYSRVPRHVWATQ